MSFCNSLSNALSVKTLILYIFGIGLFGRKSARNLTFAVGVTLCGIFSSLASAQIMVTQPPPTTITIPAGTEVTFTVFASEGSQTLMYSWQFSTDGVNFAPLPNSTGISGINNPTLVIASVQTTNNGQYRCMVTDSAKNSAISMPVTLTVTVPLAQPISQDPINNRYFNLGGQPLVLLGVSGEYLPHVDTEKRSFTCGTSCITNPSLLVSSAYCTYDTVSSDTPSIIKVHRCIDQLASNHLNLMRLWVSLNSSPGTDKTATMSPVTAPFPYPHEQPFVCTLTTQPQWNLNSFDDVANQNSYQCDDLKSDKPGDNTFFSNLKEVIGYAQSKGVMVEITLFDPWNAFYPQFSPYLSANQSPMTGSFTNPLLVVESENYVYPSPPPCTPLRGPLDSQPPRQTQVNLLIQVVNALYYYDNIYYELANEADFQSSLSEPNVTAWHKYMADTIVSTEMALGTRRHLIAANYGGQAAIDSTLGAPGYASPTTCSDGSETASGQISILNGHYVKIQGGHFSSTPVSALDLVHNYNKYTTTVQGPQNTMIWGFNETKITGYPPPSGSRQFFDFVSGMRAEAWEFLLNGGGLYDLYAFDWGNYQTALPCTSNGQNNGTTNHCNSFKAIGYLEKLSDLFAGRTLVGNVPLIANLRSMKRDAVVSWVGGDPTLGDSNVHWAALQNYRNRWLLYLHHSTISSDAFAQYEPQEKTGCTQNADGTYSEDLSSGGCYHTSYQISTLPGCQSGSFKAYWFDPVTMTILNPNDPVFTPPKLLASPPYRFDILLAIQRTVCSQAKLSVTPNGSGAGTVFSDSGGINCGTVCSADFNGGTTVTLTAQASAGSVFTGWSGDVCSGAGPCTLTMNDDTSVMATFAPAVNGARFIGQGLPTSMFGGLLYYASVTMQNTGNTTWDTTHYSLAPQNPAYNTSWGVASVPLQNYVVPGGQVGFLFVVTAPMLSTSFQWQMVQDGKWFGDVSPNPSFSITPAPQYYLGCWDDDSARALPSVLSTGGETVESCQLKAANAGVLYAGVQNGGQCYGGNILGRYPVPEEQCNTPCSANPAETCGGDFRNSIWRTVQIDVSWVKPSSASYGPANTLTVQGDALRGTGTVQMLWQDLTANGPWNTVAAQSTPSSNIWANTIPSSNYCHSYAVKAIYSGVTSQPFTYVGVNSGYCNETAWVSWIQPPWFYPGPAGSLGVAGGSSGAPTGSGVTLWWNDLTAGTGWQRGATVIPDPTGTWITSIPNVNYSDEYSVYAVYDAYSTQTTQGPCTYLGNGSSVYCPR